MMLVLAIAFPLLAEEKVQEPSEIKKENEHVPSVVDRTPGESKPVSMFNTLALDVLLPGGGFFYRKKWLWGAGFAAVKTGAGFVAWYYINEWNYDRSLYNSAKKSNKILDPNHELLFRLPDGSYKSVRQIERDYDASAQNVTITIAANAAIFALSLLLNYREVKEQNDESAPSFHAAYSFLSETGEKTMRMGMTFRI